MKMKRVIYILTLKTTVEKGVYRAEPKISGSLG